MTRDAWHGLGLFWLSVSAAWLLGGCSSSSDRACVPGAAVACACGDGKTGAQSCNASGSGYGVLRLCTGTPGTGGAAGTGLPGSGGARRGGELRERRGGWPRRGGGRWCPGGSAAAAGSTGKAGAGGSIGKGGSGGAAGKGGVGGAAGGAGGAAGGVGGAARAALAGWVAQLAAARRGRAARVRAGLPGEPARAATRMAGLRQGSSRSLQSTGTG